MKKENIKVKKVEKIPCKVNKINRISKKEEKVIETETAIEPLVKTEKKKKKCNLIWFIALSLILYLFIMNVSNLVAIIMQYTPDEINAMTFIVMIPLIILLIIGFKKVNILKDSNCNLSKSLLEGWLMILISISIYVLDLVANHKMGLTLNSSYVPSLIICYMSVGFCEEFLFRGLIQNAIVDKIGKDHKSVIKAIVISSVIFGAFHAINAFSNPSIFSVIIQMMGATAIGYYLGILYYKTKNIYAVAILHGFYDICATVGTLYYYDCITNTQEYSLLSLVIAIILLLPAIGYSMKGNLNDILPKKEKLTEDYLVDYDTKSTILTISFVIILALLIGFVFMATLGYTKDTAINDYNCTFYNEVELQNYEYTYQLYNNYYMSFYKDKTTDYEDSFIYEQKELNILISIETKDFKNILRVSDSAGNSKDISFDESDIYSFALIENNGIYNIFVLAGNPFEDNYVVYSSTYLSENTVFYKNFLNQLSESFVKLSINSPLNIGYLTLEGSNYKYPAVKDENFNYYYKDDKGILYKY